MEEYGTLSGFMISDYLLTFEIADRTRHAELTALCREQWDGEQVTSGTWELCTDLDPHQLEAHVARLLGEGDRAAYYYLTKPIESGGAGGPDAKRIFRVVLA